MKTVSFIFTAAIIVLASVAFADRPTNGHYEVPVPEQIAEYANYDVRVRLDDNSNPSRITYTLPLLLTGERNSIRLTKDASDPRKWTAPNADAKCAEANSLVECSIKYKNLTIDSAKVEALIRSKFTNEEDIQGRLAAAKFFGGEPAGVISFGLRSRR